MHGLMQGVPLAATLILDRAERYFDPADRATCSVVQRPGASAITDEILVRVRARMHGRFPTKWCPSLQDPEEKRWQLASSDLPHD